MSARKKAPPRPANPESHGGSPGRGVRLAIRFLLAAQMFYYGMAKVIPIQFMPPALTTLVQPIGAMPLSTLLWVFVGSSPLYQLFGGVAEVAAATTRLLAALPERRRPPAVVPPGRRRAGNGGAPSRSMTAPVG